MKAKNMFEELGYKFKIVNNNFCYYGDDTINLPDIEFSLKYDTYTYEILSNHERIQQIEINIKLHQAIHQQMIELGWIEWQTKIN